MSAPAPAPRTREDRGGAQTVRAQLALRDLVLSGALKPGERLSELAIVDRLQVSRTPVRAALMLLCEEGLIAPIPSGGYAVRDFSHRDVLDAIQVRGTLEGLAARLAAERGASAAALADLRALLDDLDAAVNAGAADQNAFAAYVDLNARFHAAISALSGSAVVERQIERAMSLPFASPSAFVKAQSHLAEARTILLVAQDHHRCVVEAIERREGARAEAVMREHAQLAGRNLDLALRSSRVLDLVPGSALIRRGARAEAAR